MKTLLKITIVLLFASSVAALILAVKLYEGREVLKGRTQKLENAIVAVAATLECGFPSITQMPPYPEQDIDSIDAEVEMTPAVSDFWKSYRHELELQGDITMDVNSRYAELVTYYKWDPVRRKPMKDPRSGLRVTSGPGTMQGLLNEVIQAAEDQLCRMGDTRESLANVRSKLVSTINEVNLRKNDLRKAYCLIEEKDEEIIALNDSINKSEEQVVALESSIQGYKDDLLDKNALIARHEEEISELKRPQNPNSPIAPIATPGDDGLAALPSGIKGHVTSINDEWRFVLIQLNDDFIRRYGEILHGASTLPQPEFSVVRREGLKDVFVGKVRLKEVQMKEHIGVGNILEDWAQAQIQPGDTIVF